MEAYGLNAHVVPTPGHTSGSVSVVFNDGRAIVGDLLIAPTKADYHVFIDNFEQNNQSIRRVIDFGINRFYVGHGGPISVESVFKRLNKRCFH